MRAIRLWWLALCLVACAGPAPLPTLAPTLELPATPVTATATPPAITEPAPTATPTVRPSPTPVPSELIVCQQAEPTSLYLYADDVAARAGILEALYDGPIDTANFELQPVILEELPSLANGRLVLREVTVRPDDRVVDAVDLQVKILAQGVRLAQLDGSVVTYTAGSTARTVQVTAEFRLKPGVLWSDSQQLTADDSRFSFEAAAYFDTPTSKFVTDRTQSYEVVNTLTVRWTGLPGFRDREAQRRFWSPLPRHLFQNVTPSDLKNNSAANERPVGWGPFMLREWDKGERLTLTRNPNYFRAAEGLPRVDQVTFRFGLMPEEIIREIEAGRCHLGSQVTDFTALTPQLLAAQQAGTLTLQFSPDLAFEHLDFGILPAVGYQRVAGPEVFQDVRVRQAIARCVDRQALIEALVNGLGEPPASYVPGSHPLYAGDRLTAYPFNPARGRALLDEAGWTDANGDGVRERGDRRLSLEYVSGPETSAFRQQLAQLLQTQLRACGVELRLRWVTPEDLYAPWPNGPLFGRRFDLGSFPWRSGVEPPCELYLTEAIPDDLSPGGANNLGYSSAAFDAACRRARRSFDPEQQRAAHLEAQAIFTRDLPSLPLFFRYRVSVVQAGVVGYQLESTARSDLWNIEAIGAPER
jgi:peptide/nickel transport system substrate-binding protein